MIEKRVLPADVYDTLEFAALAFGGITDGMLFETDNAVFDPNCPRCAHGLLLAATGKSNVEQIVVDYQYEYGLSGRLSRAGIRGTDSDTAVRKARRRKRHSWRDDGLDDSRVTFRQWCRASGAVRGQ